MERLIYWGTEADEKFSRLLYDKNKYQTACQWIEWLYGFVILNIGLYMDLILVAIIKFYIHRDRPLKTYLKYMEHTVDIYSFPSGHSSRAAMIVVLFYNYHPLLAIPFVPLPFIVGLSRVALGRHYITDVLAGVFFGFLEGRLMLTIPYGVNNVIRELLK